MSRPLSSLFDLSGRRALVTGGTGHVGRTAAVALAELGAQVVISDLDQGTCERAAEGIRAVSGGGEIVAMAADLMRENETRGLVGQVLGTGQKLDIVVHCASFVGTTDVPGWAVPLPEQSAEAMVAALRLNLVSTHILIQEAAVSLAAQSRGSVVLFGSIYALGGTDNRLYEGTPMANPIGYAASKGGILAMARYLATSLAPSVRVNVITPGGIERGQPASFQERYRTRTPMQRMAVEEDLKGAIAYLCSDASSYVTGHNLVVDGGWSAW